MFKLFYGRVDNNNDNRVAECSTLLCSSEIRSGFDPSEDLVRGLDLMEDF